MSVHPTDEQKQELDALALRMVECPPIFPAGAKGKEALHTIKASQQHYAAWRGLLGRFKYRDYCVQAGVILASMITAVILAIGQEALYPTFNIPVGQVHAVVQLVVAAVVIGPFTAVGLWFGSWIFANAVRSSSYGHGVVVVRDPETGSVSCVMQAQLPRLALGNRVQWDWVAGIDRDAVLVIECDQKPESVRDLYSERNHVYCVDMLANVSKGK